MSGDHLVVVYYGGSGYLCTPASGRRWLYERTRERYIRTGDEQALADMKAIVTAMAEAGDPEPK